MREGVLKEGDRGGEAVVSDEMDRGVVFSEEDGGGVEGWIVWGFGGSVFWGWVYEGGYGVGVLGRRGSAGDGRFGGKYLGGRFEILKFGVWRVCSPSS